MKWERIGSTWHAKEIGVRQRDYGTKRWDWRIVFSVDTNRGKGLEQVFLTGSAPSLAAAKKRAEADYDRALRAWSWLRKP